MTTGDQYATESGRHPLQTVNSTCLIPAKTTGVVSLTIQFVILVISASISIFFFYHVGGYEYMGWNENATILAPISRSPPMVDYKTEVLLRNDSVDLNGKDSEYDENFMRDSNGTSDDDGPTSLSNSTIHIGGIVDVELDLLELIRISTLVYVGMCLLWLLSLVMLLLSIKFEILDLVIGNVIMLTVTIMYALVHALFVAVLLYYQFSLDRTIPWRTLTIIIITIIILLVTFVLGAFCVILVVSWYRYIVFINDAEKCSCLAAITRLIKGNRARGPHEYAMPEATRHANVPYADEHPVQQFSHF